MPIHIMSEAERCLNCKKPLCQEGCPVHTPIPQVISLLKDRRVMEAGEILFKNNPLSAICSTVCNHAKQCAGACIRGKKDYPVHFSSIENYISEMYLDRMPKLKAQKKKNKKVAIIGAGPAGLTASFILAMAGYPVTIFEWKSKIGGLLQYGIPDFRLPKTILERYHERLDELGVLIRMNATIGTVLLIDNLIRDGYASIFIGSGAEKPRSLGIKGESLGNVHFALNYLANPESHPLGDKVAVIGVGNAAMDVARTALRNGSRQVTMFAIGKEIAASSSEVEYAKLDGAEIETGMQVYEITEKGPVFNPTIYGENDEIIGKGDEKILFEADSTIIAISQEPRTKLVRTTEGLESGEHGLLVVDENCMTTKKGVFAAGDVVTGAKTVVHAVEGAKRAAESMIRFLESKKRIAKSK